MDETTEAKNEQSYCQLCIAPIQKCYYRPLPKKFILKWLYMVGSMFYDLKGTFMSIGLCSSLANLFLMVWFLDLCMYRLGLLLKVLSQLGQAYSTWLSLGEFKLFTLFVWFLDLCMYRLGLLLKVFPQVGQGCSIPPMWLSMCGFNLCTLVDFFPHILHLGGQE